VDFPVELLRDQKSDLMLKVGSMPIMGRRNVKVETVNKVGDTFTIEYECPVHTIDQIEQAMNERGIKANAYLITNTKKKEGKKCTLRV